MPLKVGLTGGIASGKSTVCQLFTDLGVTVIDADIIARELVTIGTPCYQRIVKQFGETVLQADGALNRAQLRQLIFSNTQAKQKLEAILHPAIRAQLIQQADQTQGDYCILAIPLLLETNMIDLVDRILVIDVAESLQLHRLCQRDRLSEAEAVAIINNQCSRQQRLTIADDIINNDVSLSELAAIVKTYHQKYLQIATAQ